MLSRSTAVSHYLYGIARNDISRDWGTGLEERPVSGITDGPLVALVSELSSDRVRASRRNLLAHSEVLERAFSFGTVLPVRFGTVVPDESVLRGEILSEKTREYLALLDRFEGLVEMGVRAIWDETSIFEEIRADQSVVTEALARSATRPAGAAYQAQIQLGQKVEQVLRAKSDRAARHIIDHLNPLALQMKENPQLLDRMVLNAAFLMQRQSVPAFEQAVENVDREYQDRLQFRLTGPTIPYHFIELNT